MPEFKLNDSHGRSCYLCGLPIFYLDAYICTQKKICGWTIERDVHSECYKGPRLLSSIFGFDKLPEERKPIIFHIQNQKKLKKNKKSPLPKKITNSSSKRKKLHPPKKIANSSSKRKKTSSTKRSFSNKPITSYFTQYIDPDYYSLINKTWNVNNIINRYPYQNKLVVDIICNILSRKNPKIKCICGKECFIKKKGMRIHIVSEINKLITIRMDELRQKKQQKLFEEAKHQMDKC